MSVLVTTSKVETANTNYDGTGTVIRVGELSQDSYVHEVTWNALGTNSGCVGRVFADIRPTTGADIDKVLIVESTLASTTASNTAALTAVTTSIGAVFPQGTVFYASVSVDLTAEAGYVARILAAPERRLLEQD